MVEKLQEKIEKVKEAVKRCGLDSECVGCPYENQHCSELDRDIIIMMDYLSSLAAEFEAVKRERDAAVSDLNRARHCLTCEVNRDSKDENAPEFRLLCHPCHYVWRGPCKENGGAEDDRERDENR